MILASSLVPCRRKFVPNIFLVLTTVRAHKMLLVLGSVTIQGPWLELHCQLGWIVRDEKFWRELRGGLQERNFFKVSQYCTVTLPYSNSIFSTMSRGPDPSLSSTVYAPATQLHAFPLNKVITEKKRLCVSFVVLLN
jgi:hypothetical protein